MFTMNEFLCILNIIFAYIQELPTKHISVNKLQNKFYCFPLFSNFSIIRFHNQNMYAYRCKTYAYVHIQLKVTTHVHSACAKI